jgi:hypothetical protein
MAESSTLPFSKGTREENAFRSFCDFVLDPAHPPPTNSQHDDTYDRKLDELLFEILQSLFFRKLVPRSGITCLTDLILMLLWLKADGSAVLPSRATHDCAVLQYWSYTTVTHTLRLQLEENTTYREHDLTCSVDVDHFDGDNPDLANNFRKCVLSSPY